MFEVPFDAPLQQDIQAIAGGLYILLGFLVFFYKSSFVVPFFLIFNPYHFKMLPRDQ